MTGRSTLENKSNPKKSSWSKIKTMPAINSKHKPRSWKHPALSMTRRLFNVSRKARAHRSHRQCTRLCLRNQGSIQYIWSQARLRCRRSILSLNMTIVTIPLDYIWIIKMDHRKFETVINVPIYQASRESTKIVARNCMFRIRRMLFRWWTICKRLRVLHQSSRRRGEEIEIRHLWRSAIRSKNLSGFRKYRRIIHLLRKNCSKDILRH